VHRLDGREDERRLGRLDAQRLAEEAEREARVDDEAAELDLAAPARPEAVAAHLGRARGDAQREGAAGGALGAPALAHAVLDDERVGRDPALPVRDLEADAAEAAVEELRGQDAAHRDAAQRRLREHAREHEEGEHQRQHEVEQVVAGIERREPHREGDQREEPAGARRPQGAGRPQPAAQAQRRALGRAPQSGTGT